MEMLAQMTRVCTEAERLGSEPVRKSFPVPWLSPIPFSFLSKVQVPQADLELAM